MTAIEGPKTVVLETAAFLCDANDTRKAIEISHLPAELTGGL